MEELGEIERAEGNGKPIGRPTVSGNPDPCKLPETESPTKEHTQAGPRPPHSYVADVQLSLHVDPKQLERGYPKSCCLSVGYAFSSWAALTGLTGGSV